MKNNTHLQIAIDGPAGAGKSTVARELASKLNIAYLDSGAMYRAVTLNIICMGISLDDKDSLSNMLDNIQIDFSFEEDGARVYLNKEEVTEEIRSSKVNKLVSPVSAIPLIRHKLVSMQQELARQWGSVVMDGRDIGTCVLPNAPFKIYLDASLEERAKRRWKECKEKGRKDDLNEIETEISRRDSVDSSREESPLQVAPGAEIIDTTDMTLSDVIDTIITYIKNK